MSRRQTDGPSPISATRYVSLNTEPFEASLSFSIKRDKVVFLVGLL